MADYLETIANAEAMAIGQGRPNGEQAVADLLAVARHRLRGRRSAGSSPGLDVAALLARLPDGAGGVAPDLARGAPARGTQDGRRSHRPDGASVLRRSRAARGGRRAASSACRSAAPGSARPARRAPCRAPSRTHGVPFPQPPRAATARSRSSGRSRAAASSAEPLEQGRGEHGDLGRVLRVEQVVEGVGDGVPALRELPRPTACGPASRSARFQATRSSCTPRSSTATPSASSCPDTGRNRCTPATWCARNASGVAAKTSKSSPSRTSVCAASITSPGNIAAGPITSRSMSLRGRRTPAALPATTTSSASG